MTLSVETRKQAMRNALRLMLGALGNRAFDEMYHDVARQEQPIPPFDGIPWTTWDDLLTRGYVKPAHTFGQQSFALTGWGWIAALKVTQQYDTPEQNERIYALRRTLVDANKGRPAHGTLIGVDEIVAATNLPRAWVTSAVYSQLLDDRFPTEHMRLSIEGGRVIRIPSRFAADEFIFDPNENP